MLIETETDLNTWRQPLTDDIILIPTMGHLHQGHLKLVEKAQSLEKNIILSIFINPLQFSSQQDLDAYPRTLQSDIVNLPQDITIFSPHHSTIYPDKNTPLLKADSYLNSILCGKYRPNHFNGVVTVIDRLLKIVRPSTLILGEKDYQQISILEKANHYYQWCVDIVTVPTVRLSNGLAISSRHSLLDKNMLEQCSIIYATLKVMSSQIKNSNDFATIEAQGASHISASGLKVEYIKILDKNLRSPTQNTRDFIILTACFSGDARLIDNIQVSIA